MNYDLKQIRKVVDSNEIFAVSHGEEAPRRAHGLRKIPVWTKSDTEIRKILCRVFPKLAHNARQRKSAAHWLRIIYLYFRIGMTRGQVADELHISNSAVRTTLKRIRFASAGKSRGYGHHPPAPYGKRGRHNSRPPCPVLLDKR
jgi:DNA-binding NarL/FixJ family response regulator